MHFLAGLLQKIIMRPAEQKFMNHYARKNVMQLRALQIIVC